MGSLSCFKVILFTAPYSKGEDVVAVLPWEEWWKYELTEDDSNPHIALLPLHPDLRAKFNLSAAWEYARSMDGLPYGYHNLIFSWIDTVDKNYPPPLDGNLVASVMTIWNQMQPVYAANLWKEALNKRLGTFLEVVPSTSKINFAEIYIRITSVDGHKFWFMEFVTMTPL